LFLFVYLKNDITSLFLFAARVTKQNPDPSAVFDITLHPNPMIKLKSIHIISTLFNHHQKRIFDLLTHKQHTGVDENWPQMHFISTNHTFLV